MISIFLSNYISEPPRGYILPRTTFFMPLLLNPYFFSTSTSGTDPLLSLSNHEYNLRLGILLTVLERKPFQCLQHITSPACIHTWKIPVNVRHVEVICN